MLFHEPNPKANKGPSRYLGQPVVNYTRIDFCGPRYFEPKVAPLQACPRDLMDAIKFEGGLTKTHVVVVAHIDPDNNVVVDFPEQVPDERMLEIVRSKMYGH